MIRFAAQELDRWLNNPNRKPMVIRGARQVGKTWIVRDLAKRHKLKLCQAEVCTKVLHTAGNGLPLGSESNEKFFKTIMLDIGLISVQLGLSSIRHSEAKKIIFSNKGGLAEQFVGQQ